MLSEMPVHLTPETPLSDLVHPLLPDPDRLCLDGIERTDQHLTFHVHTTPSCVICPTCQHVTNRVHSRYQRTLADTAWGGCPIVLCLTIRRFRCGNPDCSCTAFTERVPHITPPHAQRTTRLLHEHTQTAHALGGAAGARRCCQQGIPTTRPTLLRTLRSQIATAPGSPTIIGIDDWSWGKDQPMGTIIVDLERRQTLALLPDDRVETVAQWLQQHPGIQVVCRDRSRAYANAIQRGAPQARQIVDRWHLIKNVGEVVQRVAERHRDARHTAANPPPAPDPLADSQADAAPDAPEAAPAPAPLTPRQTEQRALFDQVKQLHRDGWSYRAIERELGVDRRTVKKYVLAETFPATRMRRVSTPSTVLPYADHVCQRRREGASMQTIWEELQAQGFGGSYRAVRRFVQHQAPAPDQPATPPRQHLSAQQTRSLLLCPLEHLSAERAALRERLESGCPELRDTGERARDLMTCIQQQDAQGLAPWLDDACAKAVPEVQSFAAGLVQEQDAVQAALEEPWSSGQVEGQITKLKLVKRSMYGRAKHDLLEARMVASA
jgi:transposase